MHIHIVIHVHLVVYPSEPPARESLPPPREVIEVAGEEVREAA